METHRVTSAETTKKKYNEYSNVFSEIGCFKGTSLQVKDDVKAYHVLSRCIEYALQELFQTKTAGRTTCTPNTDTTAGR